MDAARFDAIVRDAAGLTRRSAIGALLAAFLGPRAAAAGVVTAESCLPNGQRCGRRAGGRGKSCRKCCSRYAPQENGVRHCACVVFGEPCGNSGQCCEGDCNQGHCGCLDDGASCRNDDDCCYSNCIDGICQCFDDGEACADSRECCYSNCVEGVCQCLEDGEACTDGFDCCFSNCIDGICQCLDGGAACTDDFDCCETSCIDGICTNGTCDAAKEVCVNGSDPDDPFCGFSYCFCLSTTTGEPYCGGFYDIPDECSGCSVDADCEEVTGPGSACVIAEDCCEQQGEEPVTLCFPPCPEPGAERASQHRADVPGSWPRRQKQKHRQRKQKQRG